MREEFPHYNFTTLTTALSSNALPNVHHVNLDVKNANKINQVLPFFEHNIHNISTDKDVLAYEKKLSVKNLHIFNLNLDK